jgi:hypothetical protein
MPPRRGEDSMNPESGKRSEQVGVWLAWLVFVITILVPIWWGADGHYPWDIDCIAPGGVFRRMASRFALGQVTTYPPLPYYMFALVYAPALALLHLVGELGKPTSEYPWGFRHPQASMTALVVLARLVTASLAAGIVWLGVRRARLDALRGGGWIVPVLALGAPTLLYYGRTTNPDLLYVFWLFLGFALLEAATTSRRLRTLAWAAVAATCAVTCKEQSATAAVVIIAFAAYRAWSGRTSSGVTVAGGASPERAVRTGASPDWGAAVLVLVSAALAYALIWRLPWDWSGYSQHVHIEFTSNDQGGLVDPRHFPLTPAGIAAIAWHYLLLSPALFGWPILIGVVAAMVLRVGLSGLWPRVLAFALYLLTMLGVGYARPRFALPLMLLLLPLAARGLAAALELVSRRAGALRVPAIAAIVLLAFWGGPRLSLAMLTDPRLNAEDWLKNHSQAGARVEIGGNPRFSVRPSPSMDYSFSSRKELVANPRGPAGDFVVISSLDRWTFDDPSLRAMWWDPLTTGGQYQMTAQFDQPAFVSDLAALPVAPTIWVYQRK